MIVLGVWGKERGNLVGVIKGKEMSGGERQSST